MSDELEVLQELQLPKNRSYLKNHDLIGEDMSEENCSDYWGSQRHRTKSG